MASFYFWTLVTLLWPIEATMEAGHWQNGSLSSLSKSTFATTGQSWITITTVSSMIPSPSSKESPPDPLLQASIALSPSSTTELIFTSKASVSTDSISPLFSSSSLNPSASGPTLSTSIVLESPMGSNVPTDSIGNTDYGLGTSFSESTFMSSQLNLNLTVSNSAGAPSNKVTSFSLTPISTSTRIKPATTLEDVETVSMNALSSNTDGSAHHSRPSDHVVSGAKNISPLTIPSNASSFTPSPNSALSLHGFYHAGVTSNIHISSDDVQTPAIIKSETSKIEATSVITSDATFSISQISNNGISTSIIVSSSRREEEPFITISDRPVNPSTMPAEDSGSDSSTPSQRGKSAGIISGVVVGISGATIVIVYIAQRVYRRRAQRASPPPDPLLSRFSDWN